MIKIFTVFSKVLVMVFFFSITTWSNLLASNQYDEEAALVRPSTKVSHDTCPGNTIVCGGCGIMAILGIVVPVVTAIQTGDSKVLIACSLSLIPLSYCIGNYLANRCTEDMM